MESLTAIEQRRVLPQWLRQPKRSLPAPVNVVVFVDRGVVTEQDEFVCMSAISEVEFSLASQVLLGSSEPRLRTFPRIEVPVKLVGTERFVSKSEHDKCPTERCVETAAGESGEATVIAVHEGCCDHLNAHYAVLSSGASGGKSDLEFESFPEFWLSLRQSRKTDGRATMRQ
jgi:hypothetical protein